VVRIVDPDLTMRMTEWVVLEVLRHHRQSARYAESSARRAWEPLRQWSAAKIRVGIMGLGELGRDSARALRALGFPVSGWSRSPKAIAGVACYAGIDGLDAFLKDTDILVALLPLTDETRGLIDRDLIDRLSRRGPLGAPVLINAGRGGLQVEADIDAAMRDGRLAGASLDVFASEPLPADSPLWTAPNLIITPHIAAESDPIALSANVLAQIAAFERGEPLQNLVDRARGY
jgi:glyoxylate/hydroxypyruvate reductase